MHAIHDPEALADELDELPPRPRTRLLTPVTVVLMLVLFAAAGFVGGVLVEKGQSGSSQSLASRLTGAGATGSAGARGGTAGASRFASLFGGGAGSRGTIGTVANVDGSKLYVTTTAGNTVEVTTTRESKVTKSQSVGTGAIHPGDSVVVTGITGANGTVTASAISDSGSGGAAAGGLGALFGGGSGLSGSTSSSTSSGGTQSLFGG
jgi:hypothetical protein